MSDKPPESRAPLVSVQDAHKYKEAAWGAIAWMLQLHLHPTMREAMFLAAQNAAVASGANQQSLGFLLKDLAELLFVNAGDSRYQKYGQSELMDWAIKEGTAEAFLGALGLKMPEQKEEKT